MLFTTGSWSILFSLNILYASDARQPVVMDFGFFVVTYLTAFASVSTTFLPYSTSVKVVFMLNCERAKLIINTVVLYV